MKVLHVLTVADSLVFLSRRSAWMAERGVITEVACSPDARLAVFGEAEEVVTHAVPMRRAISPMADLLAIVRLVSLMRARRPDIVHAHTPKGGLLGMLASWVARVPVRIYHIHGLPFETAVGLKRRLLIAAEWVSCHLATEVLAVSRTILGVAKSAGICPIRGGLVLGAGSINGVDLRRFSRERVAAEALRLRRSLGLPEGAAVVGFVGRLVADKGIVTLADAWSELRESHPDSVLLLVGKWEESDPVPDSAKNLLLGDDRVFFTGFLEDPAPAYALMTVLAFPSRREGFGLAAIEAGAMEIPVVGSEIAGLCDAISADVTGILVPRDDAALLSAALGKYLSAPEEASAHGAEGRVRASSEFAPETVWEETLALYSSLAARREA